jgi:hypothetical protein
VAQDGKEEHSSCSAAPKLRSEPGIGRPCERGRGPVRTRVRHLVRSPLLYFAAVPASTPGAQDSNYASGLVELGGLEPPAPCLQTKGKASTGVHRRRSPSCGVHPGPFKSGCVAVLSRCTHRQGQQQPRNAAVPPAASPGFLPPPRVGTGGPKVACHGLILLFCRVECVAVRPGCGA